MQKYILGKSTHGLADFAMANNEDTHILGMQDWMMDLLVSTVVM